jgi:hypothetical protein
MKKLWIALAMAMVALIMVASPALAWCPPNQDAEASVDCGEVNVTDDSPVIGTTITFYGTVTIVSTAENNKDYSIVGGPTAYAESNAWYVIYDPEGCIIASGNSYMDDEELAWWFFNASADASQTYNWSQDVYVALVGDYLAEHGGEAYAEYGHWCLFWDSTDGTASASCSASRTVTARSGITASASYIHPYLVINLPGGSRHFFSSDGWGDPTSRDIAYTDGTWQVEIQDGTAIQL